MYKEKRITANDETLLEIKDKTFSELIDEIKPSKIIGFSSKGAQNSYEKIAGEISDEYCLVFGGFQKGHFSNSIEKQFAQMYSVGDESFEGHTVVARMLYEYEKTIFM